MRDDFLKIALEYLTATKQPFERHTLAQFIRQDAVNAVRRELGHEETRLKVEGSPGKGRWAEVPWIAIFNPIVTTTATQGYYIVYLFSADMSRLELSLNQGATGVEKIYGSAKARQELYRRAELIRTRLAKDGLGFPIREIELGAKGPRGKSYEPGHAIGKSYDLSCLPSDAELQSDLLNLVELYGKLIFRGGTDALEDLESLPERVSKSEKKRKIVEERRYSYHRKIERDSSAPKEVKKHQGYTCKSCGFDFERIYGPLGREFIEAHHLTPISELPENGKVELDPIEDFTVLCANCHRMIHRADNPGDISELYKDGRLNELRDAIKNLYLEWKL